jgi:hypothetical protein
LSTKSSLSAHESASSALDFAQPAHDLALPILDFVLPILDFTSPLPILHARSSIYMTALQNTSMQRTIYFICVHFAPWDVLEF